MSIDSSDDDRDLDRLLDGGRADDARSLHPLDDLLGAAAAPARPDELRGEGEALAAFRAARQARAAHRVPGVRRFRVGPAAKVAAAVVTTLAMGSTAAAMAAGLVPNPLHDIGSPLSTHTSPGVSPSDSEARDGLRSPSAAPVPTATAPPGTSATTSPAGPGPVPSASSSHTGVPLGTGDLCILYLSLSDSQRPEALTEARFGPLVALAGEPASVDAYCDQLLGSPSPTPSGTPSPTPSPSPSTEVSSSPAAEPPEPPSESGPLARPMSAGSTPAGPPTYGICVTEQRRHSPDHETCASVEARPGDSSGA